jgi:hypothetical protein
MKVTVISAWAGQEPLAKYFAKHYAWADKIVSLVGPGPWEGPDLPGVEIREIKYPMDRFCEYRKRDAINSAIRGLESDWGIVADADEFVFHLDQEGRARADIRAFLETVDDGNLVVCNLWDVYRHINDRDLDPDQPPLLQRRCGDPNVHFMYRKPILFQPESGIQFHSGQHRHFANPAIKLSRRRLPGAHWKYADLNIAIERQAIRGRLISSLQRQPSVDVQAICQRHMRDRQLF